jgi:hypothetical protein
MNWSRVRSENLTAASRRSDQKPSAPQRTFRAKYPSVCTTCGSPIDVGDPVASTFAAGERMYHHRACIYVVTVDKAPVVGDEQIVRTSRPAAVTSDGRCQGTTKAGKPCRGGAKKGEAYCGPHLDQMARQSESANEALSTEPDPQDEPF